MSEEEEERTVFYHHAQDGMLTSAIQKQRNAIKHFDYFLEGYCRQINIRRVSAEQIPYNGIPHKSDRKDVSKFWDSMMGAFVTYIGSHARQGCDPKKDLVAKNTADGYCSSVKAFFTNKFRHDEEIPVFRKDQWKKLRDKLKSQYRESSRGKPKSEGHAPSTRRDREAMATACVWTGTPAFAEFWLLLNASYHCAGRGSEVSLISAKGTKALEVNELSYRYDVLAVDIQRQKNGPFQSLPIYPHADGIHEDFYFSLIHSIVLNGSNSEFLLPNFSKAALKTTEGKSDSGVSREWTRLFTQLSESFEVLTDEINEELSSHSARGGVNQEMAEEPGVSGLAQIYRTGWTVNSIHSVFDYVFGSVKLSHQAGKAIAKWTTKISDTIMGGQSPTFSDIKTDLHRLKKFTDILFEDDIEGRWAPKVRELLVMTLLLRIDQYVEILESHPFSTPDDDRSSAFGQNCSCSAVRDSLFLNRVERALEKVDKHAKVSFQYWTSEAKQAFLHRNLPAIAIENFALYHDDPSAFANEVCLDPRCLIDHFNVMASTLQATHMIALGTKHAMSDLLRRSIKQEEINSLLVKKLFAMERDTKELKDHLLGGAPERVEPPSPPAACTRFSVSNKTLSNGATLTDTTVAFFMEDHPAGYELDKKSLAWKDMDERVKKTLKNRFGSIKRAVKVILAHSDSYPTTTDRESIRRIAALAEERLRAIFKEKALTIHKLEKLLRQPEFKLMEKSLELPLDTPVEMKKFFKINS